MEQRADGLGHGDDYVIVPATGAGAAGTQYQIRVIDASGRLVVTGGNAVLSGLTRSLS